MDCRWGVFFFAASAAFSLPAQAIVVISQVYGGGGNTGATYQNDFIELFNADTVTISLNGWSVQYASTMGTTWLATPLTGSLGPGQYALVQEAAGPGGAGVPLPSPDITGTISMGSTVGKVALRSNSQLLTGACPTDASIVDLVGYGSGTNCFEGSGPTPNLSNSQAATRTTPCIDTDDNPADFSTASAPTPRNSATAPLSCPTIGYAAVQFPAVIGSAQACVPQTVYGRVYVAGATDISSSAAPGIVAQLGRGLAIEDPATGPSWVWSTAIPNAGWDFSQNNDEYQQGLVVHSAPVMYDYAYRWSYHKQVFVYSDLAPEGTTDGYSSANAGKLTVDGDVLYCDPFDY